MSQFNKNQPTANDNHPTVDMHPGRLFEISGSYWQAFALQTGVKLDVFTVIGHETRTGDAIAAQINADTLALSKLLNALAAMGFLEKHGDAYQNTDYGYTFLAKDSSRYVGHIIMHHHHLIHGWAQLDKAVTSGGAVRERSSLQEDEHRESFLMGMFNLANTIAPHLVQHIDLSGKTRLLDLGGGPGTYAVHFCLQNPNLEATVYDLPTTRPFAEKIIKRFNMQERIDFLDGNFLTQAIPGRYDVIWLSHILHAEGADTCIDILKKSAAVLAPGGMIIVHDFILDNTLDGPLFPALFSLNMLLGTENGSAYSEKQISSMFESAGFKDIGRHSFQGPNGAGLMIGVQP